MSGFAGMTAPMEAEVQMVATSPLQHLCPFVEEVDEGAITIKWHTFGTTFELHQLSHYLRSFAAVKISHEDLTERIHRELSSCPGIRNVHIETTWTTAGMEVRCSTSQILVARP